MQGLEKKDFDIHNGIQRAEVAKAAQGREHPFDKKRKKHKLRKGRSNKKERAGTGVKNDKFRKNNKQRKSPDRGKNEHKEPPRHQHQSQRQQNHNQPSRGAAQREEHALRSLKANTARFFETIGCEFSLNLKGIKSAYRTKALLVHPDKGGNVQEFQTLGAHLEK
jgi:hypothetical protein